VEAKGHPKTQALQAADCRPNADCAERVRVFSLFLGEILISRNTKVNKQDRVLFRLGLRYSAKRNETKRNDTIGKNIVKILNGANEH